MRLEQPLFLLLLVFLFLFLKRKQKFVQFNIFSNFKNNPLTLKIIIYKLMPFLKIITLLLIIIALANPQKIDEKITNYSYGIDIMLVLDISDSMRIEDFKPDNRLEVSKNIVKDFVKKRTADKIGLILFSGESYTKVPLSSDYNFLLNKIDEVKINDGFVKDGTAIGMAVSNAVARLKDSLSKSKIIILLTDGENNTGIIDPITASELAKDENIKIYSIAIGKDGKVPYPIVNRGFFGSSVKQYTYIESQLNTYLVSKMSEITGASFYRATDANTLEKIFNEINDLEKTKIETKKNIKIKDYFYSFIKLSFYLFIIILILEKLYTRGLPL